MEGTKVLVYKADSSNLTQIANAFEGKPKTDI